MVPLVELSVITGAVVVQILGLASVLCARLSERSSAQRCCQRIFFACLVLVGGAAVAALFLGSSAWAPCGTTLALMAVGVTFDGGRSARALV
jgi:hypothetical protein